MKGLVSSHIAAGWWYWVSVFIWFLPFWGCEGLPLGIWSSRARDQIQPTVVTYATV